MIATMLPSLETLIFSFLPFFVTMIFIRFVWTSSYAKSMKNLPPSPRGIPIIGNLHQLGSAPHISLRNLAHKYGSLILIHLGSVPVLLASSAEAAQEIMKTHDLVFANRPNMSIASIITFNLRNVGFAPYGENWRQSKSVYVLHLLSAKSVQSFRRIREEETALMLDVIGKSCGSEIELSNFLLSLTNDVICRIALGRKYYESWFKDLMKEIMDVLGVFSVGNYVPSLSWVDRLTGLEGRAYKLAEQLNAFLEGVVKDHENKSKRIAGDGRSTESVGDQDVVDILLEIQREQANTSSPIHRDTIKALCQEMFVAGTDTTSTTLEWAISEIIKHPRVMKKLRQELDEIAQGRAKITEEDLEKTPHPYLDAVIRESMRLHTPLPLLVPRESTQDVKVMGYDIAAGTQVVVNAWMISRDPTIWEDAEEFKPERFLHSSIDFKGLNFEFIPFGAGRRGCPGIQFAMSVSTLALANLIYKFDFKLPNGKRGEELDMTDSTGITVRRKYPLVVIPAARI